MGFENVLWYVGGVFTPFALIALLAVGYVAWNKVRTVLRKRQEMKYIATKTYKFKENGHTIVRSLKKDEKFGFHNDKLVVRKVVSSEELFGK